MCTFVGNFRTFCIFFSRLYLAQLGLQQLDLLVPKKTKRTNGTMQWVHRGFFFLLKSTLRTRRRTASFSSLKRNRLSGLAEMVWQKWDRLQSFWLSILFTCLMIFTFTCCWRAWWPIPLHQGWLQGRHPVKLITCYLWCLNNNTHNYCRAIRCSFCDWWPADRDTQRGPRQRGGQANTSNCKLRQAITEVKTQANANKRRQTQTHAYTPLYCGFLHPFAVHLIVRRKKSLKTSLKTLSPHSNLRRVCPAFLLHTAVELLCCTLFQHVLDGAIFRGPKMHDFLAIGNR